MSPFTPRDVGANCSEKRLGATAQAAPRYSPTKRRLDKTTLAHPAHLNRLAILNDHRNRAVTTGELEHTFVGIEVLFHVVLCEVYSAPLQILAGSSAVRTARSGVEFYRFSHTISQTQPMSLSGILLQNFDKHLTVR